MPLIKRAASLPGSIVAPVSATIAATWRPTGVAKKIGSLTRGTG